MTRSRSNGGRRGWSRAGRALIGGAVAMAGNLTTKRRMGAGRIAAVGGVVVSLVATALVFGPTNPAKATPCTDVWTGTGTSGDPFLITSRADLVAINTCLQGGNSGIGQFFRQWGDISLGTWTPIGDGGYEFKGTYDGDCYSLSSMTVTGSNNQGFFAATNGATIKNLKFVNPTVTATGDSTGVVVGGDARTTTLDTIIVTGGSVTQNVSGSYLGGIVGSSRNTTTYTKVAYSGTVTGNDPGGLVGSNAGAISVSSFTGTLSGRSGAVGLGDRAPSVTDSYSQAAITVTGALSFSASAAGLVDVMTLGKSVTNSYAAGTVSGSGASTGGTISGTAGGTSATLRLRNSDRPWATMVGLPITATNGTGALGTGTTAGTRTTGIDGSGNYTDYPLTAASGLSDGTVTNITFSGIQAGFAGDASGVTATASFFDSTLAPTPASGVLSGDGTTFNTTSFSGVTPKSTADMKTASTFTGATWSTAIWNMTDGSYPTHKWVSAFASGCSSGNPAPPSGGGGGGGGSSSGGGSSTPVVEPTPTATPTPTPSATAAVAAVVSLDPIPNQVNANIPAGGVPQGGSVFLVNGVPATVTVAPNAQRAATALDVSGPDFTMKLSGTGDDADPLGLTPRNALILQSKKKSSRSGRLAKCVLRTPLAVSSGTGFKAGSPVRMYILPSTYIGELMADASGNYSGSLPVPVGVLAGDQTLQANGFSPSGAVRSLSLGIEVKRGREVTTKAEKGSVFFEPLSTVISPQGEATLNGLVRKAKKQGVRTVVLGFVQETTTTSNDGSLSTQRARAVASYLRDRGLKGAYSVRGDGVGGPGDAARRVNVNVTYQSGC